MSDAKKSELYNIRKKQCIDGIEGVANVIEKTVGLSLPAKLRNTAAITAMRNMPLEAFSDYFRPITPLAMQLKLINQYLIEDYSVFKEQLGILLQELTSHLLDVILGTVAMSHFELIKPETPPFDFYYDKDGNIVSEVLTNCIIEQNKEKIEKMKLINHQTKDITKRLLLYKEAYPNDWSVIKDYLAAAIQTQLKNLFGQDLPPAIHTTVFEKRERDDLELSSSEPPLKRQKLNESSESTPVDSPQESQCQNESD